MRSLMIVAALTSAIAAVSAQDYPTRPINIVVPAAAGGPTDTISRVTAQAMSQILGQQITIECWRRRRDHRNRPRRPRRARRLHAADLPRRTVNGRHALPQIAVRHQVGICTDRARHRRADDYHRPARSRAEYAQGTDRVSEKPKREADFGNAGIGSASHLCGMLFMSEMQAQLTPVPNRGTAPVMNDLISKQIDMSCDQATNTTNPILGKQVKAYAVTTKTRLRSLPDLPTADEAGLKGFEVAVWHGVFAPKGTPSAIVQELSEALKAALKDPELVKRFNDINTEPMPEGQATPEAAQHTLISEIDRWAPIIKAVGEYAD